MEQQRWVGAVRRVLRVLVLALCLAFVAAWPAGILAQALDTSPPRQPVKLVFIHHSCGENWLDDANGGLGRALGENNYFVSDTNYGWGPDGVGDRTDITDWPEWFTGPESDRILAALYAESGQLSNYTRPLPDPGGQNQVVLFKSCFPNSNLEGRPSDPPLRGEGLTVGNAKAIYTELLTYFATRPDKLFVAITAPPVQDRSFADNARAFNNWLVQDWLAAYPGANVAVFDFYNVLTHPDNHHRVRDGSIEHAANRGENTLYYPSDGDDHPNRAGNQKATAEFVPLLNAVYHRWQGSGAAPPAAAEPTHQPAPKETVVQPATAAAQTGTVASAASGHPLGSALLDFETDAETWQVFRDGHSQTRLSCSREEGEAYSGAAALRIEYEIASGGWASCALVYDAPRDWRESQGLALYLRAAEEGVAVTLIAYVGSQPDVLQHFEFRAVTTAEAVTGWQRVDVAWDAFREPSWQGDGSARYDPGRAMGLAFSFDAGSSGWLRVDDVSFLSPERLPASPTPAAPVPAAEATPGADSAAGEPGARDRGGICPGSAGLGLLALASALWRGRSGGADSQR